MARAPHIWQIGLLDPQQVDALAARHLHHRDVVLVGHIRDPAQFIRRGDAAAHPWDHRKRSVLLDIGMHAVVDESCRPVFLVVAAPQHIEHVTQRRLADLTAFAVAIYREHLFDRLQLLSADNLAQTLVGEGHAGT